MKLNRTFMINCKKVLKRIFQLSLLFLITNVSVSCNQPKEEKNNDLTKAEKIEEIVSLYSEYEGFNGAVLVSHEGKVIFKKGFGFANLEWNIPNQTDTKFRIASITKPFTAMLIMQLVADGKLDLHEPISTYLPDYNKNNGDQITTHHLLSHTSGTARDYESLLLKNKYPDRYRVNKIVQQYSVLPLEFEPGEKFAYSNTGYHTLASIIETVSGKSYEALLQKNILNPLGMKNTGIDKHRTLIKNRAYGYFKGFGDYFNQDFGDMSAITGVGNIYSTVEDMFLLDQALYTEKILPKKYINLMFTKHISDPGYGGYYGYGWEFKEKPIGNTSETVETIGHSGSMQGFTALFTRIPATNSSIVFFNNTGRAFLNAMTTAITGIINNESYDFPLKPLAMFMKKNIEKEGIEKGILFYKEHKDLDDYYVSEQELIVAGYKYLQAENAEYAAEIFKLSTEVFPDRDNPYDSYAEALMTLGKNKKAIKNYKKSLELNPNNNNAVEMLKKLGVENLK
ncbi:MAG: serine hydrolase [Flavobacteriaceae bacterium]